MRGHGGGEQRLSEGFAVPLKLFRLDFCFFLFLSAKGFLGTGATGHLARKARVTVPMRAVRHGARAAPGCGGAAPSLDPQGELTGQSFRRRWPPAYIRRAGGGSLPPATRRRTRWRATAGNPPPRSGCPRTAWWRCGLCWSVGRAWRLKNLQDVVVEWSCTKWWSCTGRRRVEPHGAPATERGDARVAGVEHMQMSSGSRCANATWVRGEGEAPNAKRSVNDDGEALAEPSATRTGRRT